MQTMFGLHAGIVDDVIHVDGSKESPYKSKPPLKNVDDVIDECHEVADKFKVDPLGDKECPVIPEVEL